MDPTNPTRVPPQNLDAEASVLGSILLDNDAYHQLEGSVRPEMFYKEAHRKIFAAIEGLISRNAPADTVTLVEELRVKSQLEEVGGIAYLIGLAEGVPTSVYAEFYAKIVVEKFTLRNLIAASSKIMQSAYDESAPVGELMDRAEKLIFEVATEKRGDRFLGMKELVNDTFELITNLHQNQGLSTGVPTGFRDLDEMTTGLQPGSLNVLAARPSMGKCVSWDTLVLDPGTGALLTAAELFRRGRAGEPVEVLSLAPDGKLVRTEPGAYLDDGVKPVYRVRTRLGREVKTTLAHPFLTPAGWRPLAELTPGTRLAVPRALPVFGREALPGAEVVLLALLIGDGGLTNSSPRFTTTSPALLADLEEHAAALGLRLSPDIGPGKAPSYRLVTERGQANPLIGLLKRHGLWGKGAAAKSIPPAIYRLPREQLALFLNRLFATDGSIWTGQGGRYGRVSYSSVSRELAQGVQHLLLRFGLNAKLRRKLVRYRGETRTAFELELIAAAEIRTFATEIGALGKEAAIERLVALVGGRGAGDTRDTLPVEVWDRVAQAKGELSWAGVSRLAGRSPSHGWHPGRRQPRRETVALLAQALRSDELASWAGSDLYWDEIVSIEPAGEEQVYDLTIPVTHNFVAADICLHNTAFALSIAQNVSIRGGKTVAVFSLEMPAVQLVLRMLCSEARVDMNRVRSGQLGDRDFERLVVAADRVQQAPLFIDDVPDLNVIELRSRARRLMAEHDLGLIIIDYLQLMSGNPGKGGGGDNRQNEIASISRGLKSLARELNIPVMVLSQLSRAVEARPNHRPMLSDLRESGAIEQDADLVAFIYRDEYYDKQSEKQGIAEIIVGKQRNGPVGTVELQFHSQHVRFNDLAKESV